MKNEQTNNNQLLTASQVSHLLQISLRALYEMRYQREGPPATLIGRRLRYRRQDLDSWLSSRREELRP